MLAANTRQKATDAEMRERTAAEVAAAMDNGVRINPLLRDMYGDK